MSCNNSYMHLRVKAVQEFDQMYYATNGFGNGSDVTSSAFLIRVIWII